MLERVAVLSDIHGVLPALEAVLAEPEVAAADLIVLTGDLAAGPQPVEVLDLLASLGDRACWVRGNADRHLVETRAGQPAPIDVSAWAAGQLRDDQVARLAALPRTVTLPVAGLGEVLFCHATPRDDEEVVLVDSRLDRWAEVFADLPAEVGTVVCGHTHMPFTRLVDRRLVVNPGSVGMPYGGAGAWWALLGPGVQLRRTAYDVDAACARVAAESGYPDAAAFADEYLRSRNSDVDALVAFGPRDGR
ncbi:metallophosphoesterase family protein [Micromonospora endophytica]|uniref:YfcE family phosphodiesterase n=1 Tax=Micromonospora endophytica TaxID=515350 RepID=A0A2W2DS56_9ACTN|nr:metallophosphoesterase family protein [Micromonospora endophytica]PZF99966.1 YfcE family phosphodiesterase [Micromonospora endophytica]RIW46652.1 metallophosphoesterase [Micromonospora endophytica]BCJ59806.1 phosphoesterase [Micromonospora endophytica]